MLLVETTWVSISEEKIFFMLEKKKFHPYPTPFLKLRSVFLTSHSSKLVQKCSKNIFWVEKPQKNYMKEAGVEKVFIATDGVDGERDELKEEIGESD